MTRSHIQARGLPATQRSLPLPALSLLATLLDDGGKRKRGAGESGSSFLCWSRPRGWSFRHRSRSSPIVAAGFRRPFVDRRGERCRVVSENSLAAASAPLDELAEPTRRFDLPLRCPRSTVSRNGHSHRTTDRSELGLHLCLAASAVGCDRPRSPTEERLHLGDRACLGDDLLQDGDRALEILVERPRSRRRFDARPAKRAPGVLGRTNSDLHAYPIQELPHDSQYLVATGVDTDRPGRR